MTDLAGGTADLPPRTHNEPPEPLPTMVGAEGLRELLPLRHAALIDRFNAIVAHGMPSVIDDDEEQKKVSEAVAIIKTLRTTIERTRMEEKAPYDAASGAVQGFHKPKLDKLDELVKHAERVSRAYLVEKEERIRREREAAERAARAEAERQRRMAAEAEARAAEARARQAEIERQQREAEAAAAAKAERDRIAAELAITAPAPEFPMVDEAPPPVATLSDDERRLIDEADAQQRQATLAHSDALRAGHAAAAKPADLVRTRDDIGGMATAAKVWTFDRDAVDRNTVDLERLRPHLPIDAIHKAIASLIRAETNSATLVAPVIGGVLVYEDRKVNFRGRG